VGQTEKPAQLPRALLVKPDTVLKWIKKGVLPATRTVGGHYRVEEQDRLQALSRDDGGESRTEETALCSRPMRCWEYLTPFASLHAPRAPYLVIDKIG
jgi:excisionase family DNA binding protein